MTYLLDTNVLSEVMRRSPNPGVAAWFSTLDEFSVSAVSLEELIYGLRRRNLLAPMAIPHFAEEHSAIVDLLEAKDGPGAAEALFAHAQGGRQRMLRDGELAGATVEG